MALDLPTKEEWDLVESLKNKIKDGFPNEGIREAVVLKALAIELTHEAMGMPVELWSE